MAEARRGHLNLNFAAAGGAEVEFHDFERPRFRIGRGKAWLAKNGGLNAHGDQALGLETADVSEIGRRGNWKIIRVETALAPCMGWRHIGFEPLRPDAGAAGSIK
jgi:hypothetical protein